MNVLVIGRGGREHALVWKLSQSPRVKRIFCATGNAGMEDMAELVDIRAEEVGSLRKFAKKNSCKLTIVGPEVSLSEGIVDEFARDGLPVFGPTRNAAQLEVSKGLSMDLMRKYGVPTARFEVFQDQDKAFSFIDQLGAPLAVKANGFTAGKGLILAKDEITAKLAVNVMMKDRAFGEAGRAVVVEEMLSGDEVSLMGFTDGRVVSGLMPVKTYLRVYDGDRGPNTGGIGAYSPVPFLNREMMDSISRSIINPLLIAMNTEKMKYSGVLFLRLMITDDGPRVIELNVRFADPETQVLLPRLKTDIVDIIDACLNERLERLKIEWDKRPSVCVVACANGYPMRHETDLAIDGLDKINAGDTCVFHGRTVRKNGGRLYTAGGRAFGITSLGDNFSAARERVYDEMSKVFFRTKHIRTDVAVGAGLDERNRGQR